MKNQPKLIKFLLLFFLPCLLYSFNVSFAAAAGEDGKNPFTVKASLIRYWNQQISNNLPKPSFLISKASPLTAVDSAFLAKLAEQNALSSHFSSFCSSANLVCFTDLSSSTPAAASLEEKHSTGDVNFATYTEEKNFTNYGDSPPFGVDSFKNYSDHANVVSDSFRRYGHNSNGHTHKFANYAPDVNLHDGSFNTYGSGATAGSGEFENYDPDINVQNLRFTSYGNDALDGLDSFKNYSDQANVVFNSFTQYSRNSAGHDDKFANYAPHVNHVHDGSFNTYGSGAAGGSDEFKNYDPNTNVPNLRFTSYQSSGNGRKQTFATYSENANAGDQSFTNYGKNGSAIESGFSSYGQSTNVIGSTFKNYGNNGHAANDSFISYGFNTNDPQNNFNNYGAGGNDATESFNSYRDQANVGDDSFQSYAKKSTFGKVHFINYGKSVNEGTDKFTGYGQASMTNSIGFKIYGVNTTFTDYANKKGVSFAQYTKKSSSSSTTTTTTSMAADGKSVKSTRWVEPGKFFRESNLKQGNVMPMPDIIDKMPKRSFLPRSLLSKIPFSTSKISQLKQIFHATENSTMENILKNTIQECERAPSQGETKRCVGSIEDMIDFAVSVLGRNVVVRSIEGVKGSKKDVMLGEVKGINGGKITRSVSCHQSLYPYLVYYCHSVPKVRVYVAEILDAKSKQKINTGTAICHVDTSAWSPGHGAFAALGSSPGKIEVCHWIFEGDMTWARAD